MATTTPITFRHKRGDAWSRAGIAGIRTPDGQLMDLTGWQVRSQAREKDGGGLVCEFVCTLVDPITQTYTHAKQDTTAWPVCDLLCDVEFTSPTGFNVSTDTFEIKVLEDQTRPVTP
jgi:hypothetical protein